MNQIVAEKKYIESRLGVPYENLSQSYLRSEVELTNLSQYAFLLQRGQVANPIVTERLLGLNDEFVITHFTVGLKLIETEGTPTDTEHLTAPVYTFANLNVFTGNNANAAAIFNSNFSWIIDRKQYLPNFPLRGFLRVPTTQQGSIAAPEVVADGYDNGLYGFYPCEPTKIDGRQTMDIDAELGSAVNMVETGFKLYAVMEVRGYLVVNAKS
jgi:hypothetical protein